MVTSKKQQLPRETEKEGTLPNLPEDIIFEILSRLPVKSLCRFRCVCRSWFSLISSPQFAKTHLNLSLQTKTLRTQRQRLILSSHNLFSVEWESIANDYDNDIIAVELDYPLKDDPDVLNPSDRQLLYFKVSEDEDENPVMVKVDVPSAFANKRKWIENWGSCNGLVCIDVDEDTLFLFNPSTRESLRIPPVETLCGYEWAPVCVYGFGYDSITDDYKVVRISTRISGKSVVSLYSLRTDCWKRIGYFPYDHEVYESGVLVNGAVHWVVSKREGEDYKFVVSAFNLVKEILEEIPAPDVIHTSLESVAGALNGCLCLLHSRNDMVEDFWMMREYGVGESWTRFCISLSYMDMRPLCLVKNGEALLELDGKLVLYNFVDNAYRTFVVHGIPTEVGFEADTYVESLISPNHYIADAERREWGQTIHSST